VCNNFFFRLDLDSQLTDAHHDFHLHKQRHD